MAAHQSTYISNYLHKEEDDSNSEVIDLEPKWLLFQYLRSNVIRSTCQ